MNSDNHDRKEQGMTTITCVWCGQNFTNKVSLANHYDNVHKEQEWMTKSTKN